MRLLPLAVVLALATGAAACSARAQIAVPEPDLPVLEPPPAPPRIVTIYVPPEAPMPVVEAPVAAAPSTPSIPAPRPVAPPPPGPLVAEAPPQPPPSPAPTLTLTPVPGSEAKTEASIRALLGQVTKDLTRVNATALSTDGRTQYETVRRFVQQAEDALKARNLVYAGKLADKAATLTAVLGR